MSCRNTRTSPQRWLSWLKAGLLGAALALVGGTQAQVGTTYTFSQTSGSYTPITGGTVVFTQTTSSGATAPDDVIFNVAGGTIPFTFNYDGVGYTGLNISSNGFLTFGATAPGTSNYEALSSAGASYSGAIAAFSADLIGGTSFLASKTSGSNQLLVSTPEGAVGLAAGMTINGTGIPAGTTISTIVGQTITMSANATTTSTVNCVAISGSAAAEIRYETVGTAPNREFVVQWKNFKYFGSTTNVMQDMRLNFQIRLGENGAVMIVYGQCTASNISVVQSSNRPQVGLRGANNTFPTNVNNRLVTTAETWATSIAGIANNSACRFLSTSPATFPASGQTYTWTYVPPACPMPTGITVTQLTASTASVSWTGAPSAVVEWGTSGCTAGTTGSAGACGNVVAGSSPQTISGLVGGSTYSVYVRQDCGGGLYSSNASTSYFNPPTCPSGLGANSVTVASLPYSTTGQTTCGSGNNVTSTNVVSVCGSTNYYSAEDRTYIFTPTTSGVHNILLTTATDDDAGLMLYQGCPFTAGSSCIANAQSTSGLTRTLTPTLSSGVTYYLVVDNWTSPACIGTYSLSIDPPVACPTPTAVTVGTITSTSASISWTCTGCTGTYELDYGANPHTAGTGTIITGVSSPYTLSPPLSPSTGYQVFVRQDCSGGGNGSSAWSTGATFTTLAPPPANDDCAGAITIPTAGPFPYTTAAVSNVNATDGTDPVSSCQSNSHRGIWYVFTPAQTGSYTFSSCQSDAAGSTVSDNVLAIYTGTCGGSYTQVACDDDGCTTLSLQAIVTATLTCGTTYYIVASGYNTSTGDVQIKVTAPAPCDDADACTTDSYDCVNAVCVFTPIPTDDGDPCTVDACSAGVVTHTPIVCDDSDPCTTDACVSGVCVYTPIVCDDSDPCTIDACVGGVCQYNPILCDDSDPCTTDGCVGGVCVFTPIVCNDSDPCTTDACVGGVCVYTPIVCDDSDPCTTDACVGGVCVYTPIVCDDSDPCTTDACVGGVCVFTPVVCDDSDPCTTDACVSGVCVYTPIVCNDSDPCTTDACVGGVCVYTPIVCDDSDPCTTDACVGGVCVFTPIVCDDGNPCTTDACVGGVCVFTPPVPCDDGDPCTIDTYDCVNSVCVYTPIVCDDSDPCTTDACVGGVCVYTPIACDDGNPCTTDACVGGNCVFTPIVCDDSDPCTTDACVAGVCVYTPIVCDDSDPCTTDACVGGVCVYTPVVCDDSDPCTTDACVGGVCVFTPIVCDDSDPCTTDACVGGVCVYTPVVCDDSDPCTTDACVGGVCVFTPIVCDDSDPCTTDACVGGVCVYTPIVCNDGDACTTDACVGGVCVYTPIVCNDGDACTTDACVGGVCVYTPIVCNDGDPCTTDACVGGVCQYTPIVCDDGNPCTTDACVGGICVATPINCDDGNPCTFDQCVGGICQNTNVADGTSCGVSSVCIGGVCTTVTCSDNNVNLELLTDGNGAQTSWQIVNIGTSTVQCSGGITPTYGNNLTINEYCCLPDGCYELKVFDSFGDGMTTGGYRLKDQFGKRIIDNWNDGAFGTLSTIASNTGFCLDLGTDQLTSGSCDLETLSSTSVLVAMENTSVTAQFGITNATSGYQFQIFNPDGGYLRNIFQNMTTGAGTGAQKSRSLALNFTTNPVPSLQLLNIRVRGRINNVNNAYGPVCRMKVAPVGGCPTTQLDNNTANIGTTYSCGVTGKMVGATNNNGKIYSIPVPGANKYKFRLVSGSYSRTIAVNTYYLQLAAWTSNPLLCGTNTYNVDVAVSLNNGVSYCPFGAVCTVGITGGTPCTSGGSLQALEASETTGELSMWPNPNRGDQLYVTMTGIDASVTEVSVEVNDLFGKRVIGETVVTGGGDLNHVMELGSIASGVYTVTVTAGDVIKTQRLVIQ